MTAMPVNNKTVLLLRPEERAQQISDGLKAAGITHFIHSFIRVTPKTVDKIDTQRVNKTAWDGVVLVSKAAVDYAVDNNFYPKQYRFFAVGSTTARYAADTLKVPVTNPTFAHRSEGLLELNEFNSVNGQQWLIIRGVGGREVLSEHLKKHGANVSYWEVYERQPIPLADASVVDKWISSVDTIVVTSAEQLTYFLSELPEFATSWLEHCHWIVPSERLKSLIPIKQSDSIEVTESASDAIILDALVANGNAHMNSEETTKNDNTESPIESNKDEGVTAPKSNRRFFKRLLWLIILVAIAAAAYYGYTRFPDLFSADDSQPVPSSEQRSAQEAPVEQQDPMTTRLQQLEQSLASFERQLQKTPNSQDLSKLSHSTQRLRQDFVALRSGLESLRDEIRQSPADRAAHWRLLEVKQMLATAARMLWVQEDYQLADKLLRLADQQLVGMNTREALRTRELLAKDRENVSALSVTDNTDAVMTLIGLQERVDNLPDNINNNSGMSADSTSNSANSDNWQTNLKSNWNDFLDNFIRIQPTEADPEPLLKGSHRAAINARISLTFTLAQNAALKGNNALYKRYTSQLPELISLVKGDNAASQDVIERLQTLERTPETQQTVKSLKSLDFISRAIEQGETL